MAGYSTTLGLKNAMGPTLKNIIKALNSTLKVMHDVSEQGDKGIGKKGFAQAEKDIIAAENAMKRLESETYKQEEAAKKVGNVFDHWKQKIGVAALAMGGFAFLRKNMDFDAAFGRMDTMSQFARTIKTVSGSMALANDTLEKLKDTTLGTAYGLDVAAKATKDFVSRGLGVRKSANDVRIIADAVAFYGKGSNEQLETVSDALGKMRTKGTVGMDQLNRLFDVGINAVGIYAQAVGRIPGEVQEDLSAGTISAQEFADTFLKAMDEGTNGVLSVAGAAKTAGRDWQTVFANMHAAATRGVVNMINGIEQGLKSAGLPELKEIIVQLGKHMECAFTTAGKAISAVIPAIKIFGKSIAITGTVLALRKGLLGLAAAKNITTASAIAASIAQYNFAAAATTATGAVWRLTTAMLANPLFWPLAFIGATLAVVSAMESFRKKTDEANGVIQIQTKSLQELKKMQQQVNQDYMKSVQAIDLNDRMAQGYLRTIKELENQEKLNEIQKQKLQVAATGLKSIYMDLEVTIDSLTGKVMQNSAALAANIQTMQNQAKAQALIKKREGLADTAVENELTILNNDEKIKEAEAQRKDAEARARKNPTAKAKPAQADGMGARITQERLEKENKKLAGGNETLLKKISEIDEEIAKYGGVPDIPDYDPPPITVGGGKLDSVGKIKDDVKIKDDDIKLLKDLAAKEFSLSYTQLTPQAIITFGDVRETADTNQIVGVIEDMVASALASKLIGGAPA